MTVLTLGGGGFSMEPENPLLDDFLLSLATRRRGTGGRARVCFVPTASGDSESYGDRFVEAFAERADTSQLRLFHLDELEGRTVREHLLAQDVVYVGGGSTANLLAIWRLHGVDEVLRDAEADGIVLAGVSAGMNCWFEGSVTDSFGPLAALPDGLGLLPGSACPHYDGEEERRPTYLDLVGRGALPGGYAADDGCGLLFRDGELVEAVTSRPGARAFRVDPSGEHPLDTRHLG